MKAKWHALILSSILSTFAVNSILGQPCEGAGESIVCTTNCNQPIKLNISVSPQAADAQNIQKVDYAYIITNRLTSGEEIPISSNQAEVAAKNDTVDYITPSRNITYQLPLPNPGNSPCQSTKMVISNCVAGILADQITEKSMNCNEVLIVNPQ